MPSGPIETAMGPAPIRHEAGQSGEQAEVQRHRRRDRAWPARRLRRHSAELGYNVKCFCFQDSPRRAHSIAAQGGINAAKNYQNDGDSIYRLFYDTVKGGDFRAREANVYRLAQISVNIIDQCVAQGVPFAREYGGTAGESLLRRRAGFAHFLRARPDGTAAAARRLSGAGAADRRSARCRCFRAPKCWIVIVIDGKARGIVTRDLVTGKIESHAGRCGGPRHRRLRQRLLPLDECERFATCTAIWRAYKRGAAFGESVLHADPSDLHSRQRRLSIQAHADERIAAQRRPHLGSKEARRQRGRPIRFRKRSAITISSGNIPASAISCRATSLRAPQRRCATKAAASARRPGRLSRFRGRDQAARQAGRSRALRQSVRHVRTDHRRKSVRSADADLSGDPLHDGRPVGGLQPDDDGPRACSRSAKRISPITAPTASAPAR